MQLVEQCDRLQSRVTIVARKEKMKFSMEEVSRVTGDSISFLERAVERGLLETVEGEVTRSDLEDYIQRRKRGKAFLEKIFKEEVTTDSLSPSTISELEELWGSNE